MIRGNGQLERREGVINIVARRLHELQRRVLKNPHPGVEDPALGGERRARREFAVAELRAVAPSGHSWGRRGG